MLIKHKKNEKNNLPKNTVFKTTKNRFVVGKTTNFYLNFFSLLTMNPNNSSNPDSFFKLLIDYFTI